ncbi:polyprenyl synthetase family protein [Hominifimenecus sp. rT4P-3]|uniref:polyprenyl synthetase family protein n=1 Tax=Hominifimenecus sp. rT4P-3 TaxID=3242979 RepID=UPI003DA6B187
MEAQDTKQNWLTEEQSAESMETVLKKYLPEENGFQKNLTAAMNYSVLVGGKRIRPQMMAASYRLFGGQGKEIEPFLAAIEMIHSYSLVHDDLPAMDNDTLRRGKPTTWSAYGEAAGILAGDGLLTYAFETCAKAFALGGKPEQVGRAIGILAEKAGISGMVGGQAVDVELSGKPVSAEQLDFIYRLKTGALLEAALMIGAVLAGASEEQVKQMEKVASDIGMAFQIQDDILDVTSTEEELGKPIGSDERNQKTTYVTLYGLDAARAEVKRLSESAIQLLQTLPGDSTFFQHFVRKLESRSY